MNPTNPGQFMNPQGQGQQGAGSALLRLIQLRNQGATPQASANPVTPAAPPTGVGGPPRIMGAPPQGDVLGAGAPQMPSGMAQNAPQAVSPTTPDDNLSIALQALGGYIKSHGLAHEAKNGVPQAKAHAALIQSRANPQSQGGQ